VVPSAERRENPRFACDLAVTIEADGQASSAGRAADISFSGLCMTGESGISPGTQVMMRVSLVLDKAHSDSLPLRGTVVWCTPLRAGFQLGARFDPDMDDATWTKLDVLIRFLTGELEVDPTPNT
jgi:hypothetical protein